jgi:hypothetical protein
MKKIIVTFLLTLFTIENLNAQEGYHIGVYAMPLSSWMLNKQDSDASKDTFSYLKTYGMSAGISVGYHFEDNLGIHVNVLYSAQGQDHTYKNRLQDTVRHQLRQYFVKVPVLFKYTTDPEMKYAFTAEIGPQFNFLVGVKERNNDRAYSYEQVPFVYKTNVPSRYETFNSFLLGATLRTGLDVKLRYNMKMNTRVWADYAFTDAENKKASYDLTTQGITQSVSYYPQNRPKTTNITGGLLIGITYILMPKLHY